MNLSYQTQTATRSRFLTFEAALTYTVYPMRCYGTNTVGLKW
jgi:hypothetical protein